MSSLKVRIQKLEAKSESAEEMSSEELMQIGRYMQGGALLPYGKSTAKPLSPEQKQHRDALIKKWQRCIAREKQCDN